MSQNNNQLDLPHFNRARAETGENQIIENMRVVDYRILEYPIEILISIYEDKEIFIPDYQREYVWDDKRASRFIESVIIGLPIPFIFVADANDNEDRELDGRLEVIDGSQRIRALKKFLQNNLKLDNLKKLTELNGCTFSDLLPSRQRRFKRETIRLIELSEKADEEVRRDMFDRLNTGGIHLNPMEVRRGQANSRYLVFIRELSQDAKFQEMAPLGEAAIKRRDYEEMVVRFFAYYTNYQNFGHRVIDFVDQHLEHTIEIYNEKLEADFRYIWSTMLDYVGKNFKYGFRASNKGKVKRVRYEAISVGTALALNASEYSLPENKENIEIWSTSDEFKTLVRSDGANSKPKVIKRIEFVKNKLMELS